MRSRPPESDDAADPPTELDRRAPSPLSVARARGPTMPMFPARTAVGERRGTPPIAAVPQSGPMSSRPASGADSFSRTSSPMLTSSEKIMTLRPCLSSPVDLVRDIFAGYPDQREVGVRSSREPVRGCAPQLRPDAVLPPRLIAETSAASPRCQQRRWRPDIHAEDQVRRPSRVQLGRRRRPVREGCPCSPGYPS